MARSEKTLFLTRFSILLALEMLFCFTPLGSIPIGPIVATLAAVPVIITGIVLGPKAGTAMGAFTGLFSFLVMTFTPPGITTFVFTPFYSVGEISGNAWSLVICFVPRILIGTVSGLVFQAMDRNLHPKSAQGADTAKTSGKRVAAYAVAALAGSLTNTVGVLGGIYIFFGVPYAEVLGMAYETLLGAVGLVVLTNGIPEAIVGAVAAVAVCPLLRKMAVRTA